MPDKKTTIKALEHTIKLFQEHSMITVSCNDFFTDMLIDAHELLQSEDMLIKNQARAINDLGRKLKEKNIGKYVPFRVDGKWEGEKCSICGSEYIGSAPRKWKYCPDCGAKMIGGEDDA